MGNKTETHNKNIMKILNLFQQSKTSKTPALFPVSSSLLSKGSRSAMLGVLKSSS